MHAPRHGRSVLKAILRDRSNARRRIGVGVADVPENDIRGFPVWWAGV